MIDKKFKPVFRIDGRWTIRDMEKDLPVLPSYFEMRGLAFEDAAILACFFNNLHDREIATETVTRMQ